MGWPELLLEADEQVARAAGEGRTCVGVVEVIRYAQPQLGFAGDAEANCGFGNVEALAPAAADLLDAVLELQAAAGNDDAGVGDRWRWYSLRWLRRFALARLQRGSTRVAASKHERSTGDSSTGTREY